MVVRIFFFLVQFSYCSRNEKGKDKKNRVLPAGDFTDTFRKSFREQPMDIYQSIGNLDR